MHGYFKILSLLFIITVGMTILPVGSVVTLTEDDTRFLDEVTNEGVALLFEIPSALKTGFFQGKESSIAAVGKDQTAALDAFVTKITGYTLSDEMKKVRDYYLATADVYKKDLIEYSTLDSTCGSCVTKMNEMYPRLMEEAKKTHKQIIQFYQDSQAPLS
jgi:hypothetical protein